MERRFEPTIESLKNSCGYHCSGALNQSGMNLQPLIQNNCFGTICSFDYSSKQVNINGIGILVSPFHIITSSSSFLDSLDLDSMQIDFLVNNKSWRIITIDRIDEVFTICTLDSSSNNHNCNWYFGMIVPLEQQVKQQQEYSLLESMQLEQQEVYIYNGNNILSTLISDVSQDGNHFTLYSSNKNNIYFEVNNRMQQQQISQNGIDNINYVYIKHSVFGYVLLSMNSNFNGLYHYGTVFNQQVIEAILSIFTQSSISLPLNNVNHNNCKFNLTYHSFRNMRYLEGKGKLLIEEPAEQENKQIICMKQLNNQFMITSHNDGSANFWHIGSLNIGQTLSEQTLKLEDFHLQDFGMTNNSTEKKEGIQDMISEGYFGIFIIRNCVVLLNWLNSCILDIKQFQNELTCIHKRPQQYQYLIGDVKGQILMLSFNHLQQCLEFQTRIISIDKQQQPIRQIIDIKEDSEDNELISSRELHSNLYEIVAVLSGDESVSMWQFQKDNASEVCQIQSNSSIIQCIIPTNSNRLYISYQDSKFRVYEIIWNTSDNENSSKINNCKSKLIWHCQLQYPVLCGKQLNKYELAYSQGCDLIILNVVTSEQERYTYHQHDIQNIIAINPCTFITYDSSGCIFKWSLQSSSNNDNEQNQTHQENSQINNEGFFMSGNSFHKGLFLNQNISPDKIVRFFSTTKQDQTNLNVQFQILQNEQNNHFINEESSQNTQKKNFYWKNGPELPDIESDLDNLRRQLTAMKDKLGERKQKQKQREKSLDEQEEGMKQIIINIQKSNRSHFNNNISQEEPNNSKSERSLKDSKDSAKSSQDQLRKSQKKIFSQSSISFQNIRGSQTENETQQTISEQPVKENEKNQEKELRQEEEGIQNQIKIEDYADDKQIEVLSTEMDQIIQNSQIAINHSLPNFVATKKKEFQSQFEQEQKSQLQKTYQNQQKVEGEIKQADDEQKNTKLLQTIEQQYNQLSLQVNQITKGLEEIRKSQIAPLNGQQTKSFADFPSQITPKLITQPFTVRQPNEEYYQKQKILSLSPQNSPLQVQPQDASAQPSLTSQIRIPSKQNIHNLKSQSQSNSPLKSQIKIISPDKFSHSKSPIRTSSGIPPTPPTNRIRSSTPVIPTAVEVIYTPSSTARDRTQYYINSNYQITNEDGFQTPNNIKTFHPYPQSSQIISSPFTYQMNALQQQQQQPQQQQQQQQQQYLPQQQQQQYYQFPLYPQFALIPQKQLTQIEIGKDKNDNISQTQGRTLDNSGDNKGQQQQYEEDEKNELDQLRNQLKAQSSLLKEMQIQIQQQQLFQQQQHLPQPVQLNNQQQHAQFNIIQPVIKSNSSLISSQLFNQQAEHLQKLPPIQQRLPNQNAIITQVPPQIRPNSLAPPYQPLQHEQLMFLPARQEPLISLPSESLPQNNGLKNSLDKLIDLSNINKNSNISAVTLSTSRKAPLPPHPLSNQTTIYQQKERTASPSIFNPQPLRQATFQQYTQTVPPPPQIFSQPQIYQQLQQQQQKSMHIIKDGNSAFEAHNFENQSNNMKKSGVMQINQNATHSNIRTLSNNNDNSLISANLTKNNNYYDNNLVQSQNQIKPDSAIKQYDSKLIRKGDSIKSFRPSRSQQINQNNNSTISIDNESDYYPQSQQTVHQQSIEQKQNNNQSKGMCSTQ